MRLGVRIDAHIFDDWIIEVDNKSITHRPDLWGHYGIAREIAAMYGTALKPYPVTPIEELASPALPEVPIVIDDPVRSPRYSALRFAGVKAQPSPLWMQVRLAHVGLRPIDLLVDLTNYIMAELGQPMHAFDARGIERIEVAVAQPGERFTTLDGVKRTMPAGTVMIQSNRRSVAIGGIMGGADTEIQTGTTELLLESANFEPATIRRAATAMGHRTDASARFEKSLDPAHTVLAIQRFVKLARAELPEMKLTSRLSDAFPNPPQTRVIQLDPKFVSRYIGREITVEQIEGILRPLAFEVRRVDDRLDVTVPSFRATKDITIDADLVEEIARCLGYGTVEPALPHVTVRYAEPDAPARLERATLALLTGGMSYAEVHRYIWFDDAWLSKLGFDPGPTIRLRNPAAMGQERLRTTLVPGLLAAVDLNRRHFERFELLEVGSVFVSGQSAALAGSGDFRSAEDHEDRRLALVRVAPGRKAAVEDELHARLKTDLTTWMLQMFGETPSFQAASASFPWQHEVKTSNILLGEDPLGRVTVVPTALRRRIDEHLQAWSIAISEVSLSMLSNRRKTERRLAPVPVYPQISLDFSVLSPASRPYAQIEQALARFDHALLRRLSFVDSFEGGAVPTGRRSFMFRATIGDPTRTLSEADVQTFRQSFIEYLARNELPLRT
jgi:phenylalanyl-tRNA synthetase beta chain